MKIYKINKKFRNGNVILHFFDRDDITDEEEIKYETEVICDREGSGSNYGYSWDYEEVTDIDEIKILIEKEVNRLRNNIKSITDILNETIDYYNNLEIK